ELTIRYGPTADSGTDAPRIIERVGWILSRNDRHGSIATSCIVVRAGPAFQRRQATRSRHNCAMSVQVRPFRPDTLKGSPYPYRVSPTGEPPRRSRGLAP